MEKDKDNKLNSLAVQMPELDIAMKDFKAKVEAICREAQLIIIDEAKSQVKLLNIKSAEIQNIQKTIREKEASVSFGDKLKTSLSGIIGIFATIFSRFMAFYGIYNIMVVAKFPQKLMSYMLSNPAEPWPFISFCLTIVSIIFIFNIKAVIIKYINSKQK